MKRHSATYSCFLNHEKVYLLFLMLKAISTAKHSKHPTAEPCLDLLYCDDDVRIKTKEKSIQRKNYL